jgi:hypothetical protein
LFSEGQDILVVEDIPTNDKRLGAQVKVEPECQVSRCLGDRCDWCYHLSTTGRFRSCLDARGKHPTISPLKDVDEEVMQEC